MFSVEKKKKNPADSAKMEPSVKARREVEKFDRIKALNKDSTRVRECQSFFRSRFENIWRDEDLWNKNKSKIRGVIKWKQLI